MFVLSTRNEQTRCDDGIGFAAFHGFRVVNAFVQLIGAVNHDLRQLQAQRYGGGFLERRQQRTVRVLEL